MSEVKVDPPTDFVAEDDRLDQLVNALDVLERLSGRGVFAREIADALGWSSTHLAEALLDEAVELGCVVRVDGNGCYRLG